MELALFSAHGSATSHTAKSGGSDDLASAGQRAIRIKEPNDETSLTGIVPKRSESNQDWLRLAIRTNKYQ